MRDERHSNYDAASPHRLNIHRMAYDKYTAATTGIHSVMNMEGKEMKNIGHKRVK
jgi:hypothetical protein